MNSVYSRLTLPPNASSTTRTNIFLGYLLVSLLAESFVTNAYKFVAFELTGSYAFVSLIGSLSAVAFITIGLVSGMIVDAFSRRLFAVLHLLVFSALSVTVYIFFQSGLISVWVLIFFILLQNVSSSFHKAANNTIFFDLCGNAHLARWISRRGIVFTVASMASSLLLSFFVSENSFFFLIYAFLLILSYLIFIIVGYKDQNERQKFSGVVDAKIFFTSRFVDFLKVCFERKLLLFTLIFSFLKTFFIFWPMASGALFKFGIEDPESRRAYLMAIIFMDIVTIIAMYFLGKKLSFSNKSFVFGAGLSGLGILFFAFSEGIFLNIVTLSVMYIGLAWSRVASGYVLRMELPEMHRTQGLSFAVVPYYLADIASGIVFALLLSVFSVNDLLLGSGAGLIALCLVAFPLAHMLARNSSPGWSPSESKD